MERVVAPVVRTILNDGPVDRDGFVLLLDWLDKIRIGLWTWYYHMDKNMAGIDPMFAIVQRIAKQDRMVIITKSSDTFVELTYRGCNTPSFYYTPSCFSLMLNQYAFTSISTPFLIAKDVGLPYPVHAEFMPNYQAIYSIVEGTGVLNAPAFASDFRIKHTTIFQPIWAANPTENVYDTEYARSIALDHAGGIGAVFLQKDNTISRLDEQPTTSWVPEMGPDTTKSRYLLSKAVIMLQDRIDSFAPSPDLLPEAGCRQMKEIRRTNHEANMRILDELTRNWKLRSQRS